MNTKEQKRPSGGAKRPQAGRPQNRKASAARTASRKRRSSPKRPSPDVVYTQPGPFNRNRFLLQLVSVVAVVLALMFGMSIFFKVDTVTVAGANKYTEWDVRQASGIQQGENLLTISEAKLSGNIRSKLPYVDTVRVGIKLPDTVKIEIKELDVVYAVEAADGSWLLMRADGCVVENITAADAETHTRVLGVKVENSPVGQTVRAVQPAPETTPEGATVPVTVAGAQKLDVAISILQYLEENGVIGEAASVNVGDPGALEIWYGDRFQILLGDSTQLSYKIKLVKTAITDHMQSYDSGVLDVSLTVQPDPEKEYQVIYTPFA